MAGAFIISRDIFDNALWQNQMEFRLFFLILGKAIFLEEGQDIAGIHLNKGQWLRSYRNLQTDLEYIENHAIKKPSLSTLKRLITKLERDGRIVTKSLELGTLFTVCNYCKYQDFESYRKATKNNARNRSRTDPEQIPNNNNKDNNVNKDNKDIYTLFDQFWKEYPKKQAKQDAVRAWGKIKPDGSLFTLIMDGLGRAKKSKQWVEGFILNPATFLNGRRWEDEYTEIQPDQPKRQYKEFFVVEVDDG